MRKQDIPGFGEGQSLKAEDLQGKRVKVIVESISVVELDGKNKPKMTFKDREKSMILNVTNWNRMVELTGSEDSDKWIGQEIQLFPTKVEFQGKMVDAIRVWLPEAELDESDIPF